MNSRYAVPAPEVLATPVTDEPCITLTELMELRAELDSLPGRSSAEVADELWNLTEGDGATDTLASFRTELGLCADGESHTEDKCVVHGCPITWPNWKPSRPGERRGRD